ncbi:MULTISPECIES: ABC transporter substrate-binding protein [Ensifer]|uniref:ABC transporter substrate-binding protein n=1 Tax=Ensifer canadensis TaxID=555315 RepID=A0AAW4FM19_9HYPH|nr:MULTISPECIES: ABC transporter substrate-binding protein [Ensifer]KQU73885.1 ferrichrome ABC transporter [Ensifer sp. Root31]KQW62297.1 ferrichrome ABC transporter [Ensifer sp. Root127]MBD9488268.1 ABC transporter substrate-binding protein [Ensifer sp. ENS11]MBM3092256.1 ABC transporter substrate-binding protein [Ensifer canadensis]NOV16434.1 ferrichrome ABC transporter [Ensifer canadensis]
MLLLSRSTVRALLAIFVTTTLFATGARAENRWPLTVKDAAGREVTLAERPKAILLGSGFNLVALSLIHPDPVSLLAGWSGDMKGDNPEIYESFRKKFPAIADVPLIDDGGTGAALSFETLLTLKADLAILANWQADTEPGQRAIDYLTSTGVPVIVVDFNSDPLKSTPDMMRLLGRIFERDEQAEAFARYYEDKLALIRSRVAAKPEPRPTVLMDAFPKPDRCCWAYGVGGLGEFLTIAGGRNIAEGALPRVGGTVNAEAVMAANPDVYIATSSPGGTYSGFSIGPGVARQEAQQTLAAAVATPALSSVAAVENGRVHGVWNFFNAIPLNIVAAEAFAHWLRPDIFADLDPEKSLADINERFAAVPFEGTYTVSLGAVTPR